MTLVLTAEFNPRTGRYEVADPSAQRQPSAEEIRAQMQDQANRTWMQMGVPGSQQQANEGIWGSIGSIVYGMFS